MDDVRAEAGYLQLILHNDDETPLEFVVQLLHSVFNKPVAEATTFAESIDSLGKAVCGVYPRDIAEALLEAARMRIRRAGHSLVITSAAAAESGHCTLCDGLCGDRGPSLGIATLICDSCTYEITRTLPGLTRGKQFSHACEALAWHFAGVPRDQLVATSRQFPGHMRADVQAALDKLFSAAPIRFFGIHEQFRYDLARLMQPAMVVIEDVDLIGRDRDQMGPCEEISLNGLLNEMDGLKQDADILFVLTTNRPEQLEGALANRPGRIDQAIEVPLPDEPGRRKLVRLYGKGLPLGEPVVSETAQRTKGVSAAFIKELMRRIAQASIARDGGKTVESADIGEALDDMLFAGGKLNIKLLGGAQGALDG